MHFNEDFAMKPHQLAEGVTPYVKKILIGLMEISQVTLVVAWGIWTPVPLGQPHPCIRTAEKLTKR